MRRTYSVKAVALALGVSTKWADNLLSRHALPGVERSRQGVERRISDEGLLAAEISRILNLELGLSVERAVAIAREVVNSSVGEETTFATVSGLVMRFPLGAIERRLRERMIDALEATVRVPRGRPPRSPKT